MKKILLFIVPLFLVSMSVFSSFALDEKSTSDLVRMTCDQGMNRLILKYDQSNDDFSLNPNLPQSCYLHKSKYRVFGKRGPFGNRLCGAQPPVSITLQRNGSTLVNDTVLGGNCFGGPSIAEVEIHEQKGKINTVKLCIFREFDSPVGEDDKHEPVCKYFRNNSEIKKLFPITQKKLYDYIPEKMK